MEQQNSKSRKRLLLRSNDQSVPTTPASTGLESVQEVSLVLPAHMEMYFADKPTCDWQVEENLPLIRFPSRASWRNGSRLLIRQRRALGRYTV